MAAKTASGIPLGSTGPHAVQPLPDKPRFGHPVSEADLAAWNIDVRTPDAYAEVHIKGARNLALRQVDARAAKEVPKQNRVVLY